MSSRRPDRARRWPVLLLVPAALVGAGLADRAGAPTAPMGVGSVQPAPVAAPVGAFSSSWFCAGAADSGASSPAGAPSGSVVVYNPTSRIESAVVQVLSTSGGPVSHQVSVPANAAATVSEAITGGATWTGAVVDVDGSAAVEEVLNGPLGRVIGQCASSGSQRWYLPSGQTYVNADETILLMNPSPSVDSIVDMTFTTNQGQEQPQAFQSLSVPPAQILAVDLQSHLRRRTAIAATVTARVGRIVAWGEQIVTKATSAEPIVGTPAASAPNADPALAVPGVSLTLGAPSAGTTWTWPDGLDGNGMSEQYLIYNPGAAPADVSLAVGLAQGNAEPFTLTVAPGQVVPVVSQQETRIPDGSPHTATLTSTNGVAVVGVRAMTANAKSTQMSGIGQILGERVPAADWVVPETGADKAHRGQVIVMNPGGSPVTVTLGGASTSTQTVAAQGRAAVAVTAGGVLTVNSSGPVFVEYDLYGAGATPGYSIGPAVPLAGT